jgi:2-polyprenyl-6-methoxyphenol hydroxylase-like FAD-dependent oxidoreductase
MTPVRTALIVGAGIAGPATALALRRAGIEAAIHEARPSGAADEGAFLTLATNGLVALEALGAPEAAQLGFPTPEIVLRSASGRRLGATPTGLTPPDGPASRTLRRSALSAVLTEQAAAAGIPAFHDRRLVDVADGPDGVTALFADGTRATADVLIGADGVFSTVRRLIDPDAPAPRYTGLLNAGGTTRGAATGTPPGTFEMVFGRRAFFGHVGAPDGATWWFANLPRRDEPGRDEARDPAALRAELLELFRGDAGPAAALIGAADELWALGPTHAVPHLPHWHAGRMAVLGDAAHAPTPSSGQGASLALEDAAVLAACLRAAPGHREAFERFEALRRRRVERIVRQALRTNASKAPGPAGRAIRDGLMPLFLRLAAGSKAQREVVAYRAQDVAPEARAPAAAG